MFIGGLFAIAMAVLSIQFGTTFCSFLGVFLLVFGFALCTVDYYSLYNKVLDIEDKIKRMEDNNNANK